MRRERDKVLRVGRMASFESGGVRDGAGVKGALGVSVAVGRRKEISAAGTDFVRWKGGARCVVRKEGVAKSFCVGVKMTFKRFVVDDDDVPRCWRSIHSEH